MCAPLAEWRNGRRGGFKIRCPQGHAGSSPASATQANAANPPPIDGGSETRCAPVPRSRGWAVAGDDGGWRHLPPALLDVRSRWASTRPPTKPSSSTHTGADRTRAFVAVVRARGRAQARGAPTLACSPATRGLAWRRDALLPAGRAPRGLSFSFAPRAGLRIGRRLVVTDLVERVERVERDTRGSTARPDHGRATVLLRDPRHPSRRAALVRARDVGAWCAARRSPSDAIARSATRRARGGRSD